MSDITVARCMRCQCEITTPQVFSAPKERHAPAYRTNIHFILESGVRMLVHAERVSFYYCPACALLVRMCVLCGCTDDVGCEEGCAWAERGEQDTVDVCTDCLPTF